MSGTFTKNTIITFVTRSLQLILTICISIIIARVLGPEGKGIYSLVLLLPTFLITFTSLGIGPASVYFIGKKKYTPQEVLGANIIYSILISIFAISIGLIVIFFFGEKIFPKVGSEYLLLSLILIPFNLFLTFILDILLGLQEIKKYNFITLIQYSVLLLLIAIFLLGFHFGIKAAVIADILSIFIACIILFLLAIKETKGIVFKLNKSYFKDFSSYGAKIYIGNIFGLLHYRVDMFLLNIFLNPVAVGIYSVAVGISEKIWLISQSAGIVIFPRVSSETNKKRLKDFTPLVCRNILFITFLIALILFFLSRWIILILYSERFLEAVTPFQVLLIGAISLSGARIISNDLAGRGKPLLSTYTGIFSVIFNIILNIIWIPKFGIMGAAWASAISYTSAFLFVTIVYSKISGNRIRDIIFIKKSDFRFYKNFIILFKSKIGL